MFNISQLLGDLALEKPVFHSELDFQHPLAWRIREVVPGTELLLERLDTRKSGVSP